MNRRSIRPLPNALHPSKEEVVSVEIVDTFVGPHALANMVFEGLVLHVWVGAVALALFEVLALFVDVNKLGVLECV